MSKVIKKKWRIKELGGKREVFEFYPIFEVVEELGKEGKDVECKMIELKIGDKEYLLPFQEIFMFIYFCANEEFRRGLLQRYQRRIHKIPYDVSFKLDKEEMQKGFAKRRIELPIDELTFAIAKNEAWKLWPNVKTLLGIGRKPWELFPKRSNKNNY